MASLTPLDRAILRTLAYYDMHDYPLTPAEIWRWLYAPSESEESQVKDVRVENVEQALAGAELQALIERVGEYVVLKGRSNIVDIRKERFELNKKKWKRALTVARYVEIVPFVRMVAVVNTVAINNGKTNSDIDLLVVTAPHHIWITRMAVTGIVALLGYRRHGTKIANRVCLSFYVSMAGLNLEPLKREDSDPHFMFWAAQAVPLLDTGAYEKYVEQNAWITKALPNAFTWDWKKSLIAPNNGFRNIRRTYEAFFNSPIGTLFEGWVRDQQMKRFNQNTHSKSREANTDVIISEDVLKFHEADRRLEYNQKFRDKLQELGL
jgi:hypothetical protein